MRRFIQSNARKLLKTKLKSTDTVGRKLPSYVLKNFSDTVFKTEDGVILSLWHWTDSKFSDFKYGDIGFLLGHINAALSLMKAKKEAGFLKELYFNSENPLFIDRDLGRTWTPHMIINAVNDVFTNTDIAELSSLPGYFSTQYDSVASIRLREMLKSKGYDSIIYTNDFESGLSVIAFDNKQLYTVAENGIEVFNHSTEGKSLQDGTLNKTEDEIVRAAVRAVKECQ